MLASVNCALNELSCFVYAGNFSTAGNFNNVGEEARVWSSTLNSATNAHRLRFESGLVNVNTNNKGNGNSVRCVL